MVVREDGGRKPASYPIVRPSVGMEVLGLLNDDRQETEA